MAKRYLLLISLITVSACSANLSPSVSDCAACYVAANCSTPPAKYIICLENKSIWKPGTWFTDCKEEAISK